MQKDLDIKPFQTTLNISQDNTTVEWLYQVIYNMLINKGIYNTVFDYLDPLDEIISYIAREIRASHCRNIGAMPGQYVFSRDIIFNLASVFDRQFITYNKQGQVEIGAVRENAKQVSYD